jgi:leucyl-tRNA synthetase
MKRYLPNQIEKKWQDRWEKTGIYKVKDKVTGKKNYYCLLMFPYSSGDAHIGHWFNYSPADAYARFMRMKGYNVLHPMGFDAFGLPAEGAAIRERIHPAVWTKNNVKNMTRQLKTMGTIYDWSRMVDTSVPEYYRWTQWMFLQMYKHSLAYKAKATANWCPKCKSVLANEQAEGGKCWRCQGQVEQREIEQWFFKTTAYADELLKDLKKLDWPEKTLTMQKNWIGRSEGCMIEFPIAGKKEKIATFTTRPDTIFGVTFFCLAPEHPAVPLVAKPAQKKAVEKYIAVAKQKTELERISEIKDKTGVFTGGYVINPLSREKTPVFVADYVLMTYGTGAVMGVPAHDQRDWDFAKKYKRPITEVISGGDVKKEAYTGEGKLVNSGHFSGLDSQKAIKKITNYIKKHQIGKSAVQYHLRDWLISRQRYWGAPIPMIYCQKCGQVPVPEKDLPVKLPEIKDYTPEEGESPLARASSFVNTNCPKCSGKARRDTDTMDTFVCSSWYYFRYPDPKNKKIFASKEKLKTWMPIDMYIGGTEHTVLHLLYSRFFTKALRDFGYLDFDEPFLALRHQGIVLGEDGYRMSKSRGNVVAPDPLVKEFGADTVRLFLSFMGPYDQGGPWSSKGMMGLYRFLKKVWQLSQEKIGSKTPPDLSIKLHQTIKKVTEDLNELKFNTAVAAMMEFSNAWVQSAGRRSGLSKQDAGMFLRLLAPFAPHITEELWVEVLKNKFSIHQQAWPKYDPKLAKEEKVEIVIQVNGKLRDRLEVSQAVSKKKADLVKEAKARAKIEKYLKSKKIKKTIFVPGKLINFVV